MANDNKTHLTAEGLVKLQEELHTLRTVRRQEIADRLNEAIKLGDLSENAEYESAKDEQAFIQGRIAELEHMLKTAELIDKPTDTTSVRLGSTVVLLDMETGEEETYSLVGTIEADPFNNSISNDSPVGKAIMGQRVNTIVVVNTPVGELQYKIISLT